LIWLVHWTVSCAETWSCILDLSGKPCSDSRAMSSGKNGYSSSLAEEAAVHKEP
jgi:hypothetical protein